MGECFDNILVCFEWYEVVRAPTHIGYIGYIGDDESFKHMWRMSVGEKCVNSFRKYKMINCVYLRNIPNNQKHTKYYIDYK